MKIMLTTAGLAIKFTIFSVHLAGLSRRRNFLPLIVLCSIRLIKNLVWPALEQLGPERFGTV